MNTKHSLFLASILLLSLFRLLAADFYVSSSGDDKADGSLASQPTAAWHGPTGPSTR